MEDEENGDLFIPCRMCCQKCFTIHGKYHYHEKKHFDGCISFFKVMVGDFEKKLNMPPAFASQFVDEWEEHIVLQGPSGHQWNVQLFGMNNNLELRHGWEKFVNYHGLQLGDFVVFKYISNLCFEVEIFGKNGCVKDISALHLEKKNFDLHERSPDQQPKLLMDLVFDEENNYTAEIAVQNQRRKIKSYFPSEMTLQKQRRKRKSGFPGHSSKKHMAIESAAPFKSDKLFCIMAMKSWNVNEPYMLEFRKLSDCPIQLPKQRSDVLLVGECEKWKVKCIIKHNRPTFSGGWRFFTRSNNLKEGDICIFEQLNNTQNKFMFKVHIFPRAKKDQLQQQMEEEKKDRNEEHNYANTKYSIS